MTADGNNLNNGFNSESTSSDLIEALTNLHEKIRKGLDLVRLREMTEETVTELYQKRNQGKKGEIFPMATAIFLESERKKTSIFYAFTLNDETKRDSLNLQIIPSIGQPYPSDSEKLFIDIALQKKVPIYGERKDSQTMKNYRVHYYDCWIASKIGTSSLGENSLGNPVYQDVVVYEPLSSINASDESFFENILFSTAQVLWPFSEKKILTSTIISLKGIGKGEKISLSKYLPVLILDCSIGMVISQLFLSYALLNTSLRDLEPLIEEMLMKSWFNIIENNIEKLKSIHNEQFKEDVLNLIFNIPYPFVLVSVIRYFVKKALRIEEEGLIELLKPRLEKLLQLEYPVLGSLIVSDTKNEALVSLYSQIVDMLLESAENALKHKENKKLRPLLGNLGEFLDFRHKDILSFVLKLSKNNTLDIEIRQEILGIIVKAINQSDKQMIADFRLWPSLSDFIKSIQDKNQWCLFASCSATLLSQQGIENTEKVVELLDNWNLPNKIGNILNIQLNDIKSRLNNKPKGSPKLIGVFSQKGGVGKSTVALMTAIRIAKLHNKKVCLVELDFGGPTFYNYEAHGEGPFVNDFFDRMEKESKIQEIYKDHYKDKLPTPINTKDIKLSIWPVSPLWEEQIQLTTPVGSYIAERGYEESILMKMISLLAQDYDILIFDVPAEIKDISLTVGNIVSDKGGVILMVSSLFTPSYSPLIEHYWRFLSSKKVTPALIMNRTQLLDLYILNSCRSLVDYLLVQKSNISFRAFGMDIHSPALLRTFLPANMKLIPIKNSEEIERVNREKDIHKMISILSSSDEEQFDQFLQMLMKEIHDEN